MKYNTRKQQLQMGLVMSVLLFGTSACLAPSGSNMTLDTLLGQNGQAVAASTVSLMVSEQGSAASIYTDIGRLRSFSMTAGKSYIFKVSVAAMPSGSSIEIQSVNTSLPSALQQNIPLNNGSGLMTPAVAGDYAFQITIKDAGGIKLVTKDYSAGVSCANPLFTANSLRPDGLSVSGSNNLYNYSAGAVIASANGQIPYKCAYDVTGVGIVATGFVDCTQALANQYSPYIQNRKVGVVIKDACNTAYTVTKDVTLPATTPASPGNVFIAGVVSSETGTAANDVRVKGVNYLATNVGGHNIVSPSYGGQNFVIQSFMSYGQPSSIDFGIKIEVTGLTGSFNLRNNVTGNVDASQARVSKITYITDEAGDHAPTVSFTSVSCTTSGLHAQVKNPTGTPCSTGSTGGSKNSATVEVWGDYTCTNVSNGAGSMTITGSFDGYTYLVDSCESGGGGGGVVPIRL